MLQIVYPDQAAQDARTCRDRLPPELPGIPGALVSGGRTTYPFTWWLAHVDLLDRWQDQLWRERQEARKQRLNLSPFLPEPP